MTVVEVDIWWCICVLGVVIPVAILFGDVVLNASFSLAMKCTGSPMPMPITMIAITMVAMSLRNGRLLLSLSISFTSLNSFNVLISWQLSISIFILVFFFLVYIDELKRTFEVTDLFISKSSQHQLFQFHLVLICLICRCASGVSHWNYFLNFHS